MEDETNISEFYSPESWHLVFYGPPFLFSYVQTIIWKDTGFLKLC